MSVARIALSEFDEQVPPVCAVTGQPTPDRVPVTFNWVPPHAWRWNVFGLHPMVAVIANKADTRSVTVRLPLTPAAHSRWRARRAAMRVLLSTGAALLMTAIVATSPTLLAMSLVAGMAGVAFLVAMRRALPQAHLEAGHVLVMRRVHPSFSRALHDRVQTD